MLLQSLTFKFCRCCGVGRRFPSVLMLLKLLHFAAVQASVISGNVDDQEVVDLALLHYY